MPETGKEVDGVITGGGSVSISGTYAFDLVVDLSSDDTTEVTVPSNVTIPSGQTTAAFDLTVIDDGEIDFTQTVTVSASSAGWTSGSCSMDILDRELGSLQFSLSTYTGNENGGSANFRVVRAFGSFGTVNLDYTISDGTATAGVDYAASSGTLIFADGETSKTVSISMIDDSGYEMEETIHLSLSAPTGGASLGNPTTAVLFIQDDDANAVSLPYHLYDGDDFQWDIQSDGAIWDGTSDAYDGGHHFSGFPGFSDGNLNMDREVFIGPAILSGLEVTRRIYVPQDHAYARFLEVLHNPENETVSYSVSISTNLGSDGSTILVGTSDGDTLFTTDDNWIVTDDMDGTGSPAIVHVIANDHGEIRPSSVSAPTGSVTYSYDLALAPGETRSILHFGAQNSDQAEALAKADLLMDLDPEDLSLHI